jgi:hypothetical protein
MEPATEDGGEGDCILEAGTRSHFASPAPDIAKNGGGHWWDSVGELPQLSLAKRLALLVVIPRPVPKRAQTGGAPREGTLCRRTDRGRRRGGSATQSLNRLGARGRAYALVVAGDGFNTVPRRRRLKRWWRRADSTAAHRRWSPGSRLHRLTVHLRGMLGVPGALPDRYTPAFARAQPRGSRRRSLCRAPPVLNARQPPSRPH